MVSTRPTKATSSSVEMLHPILTRNEARCSTPPRSISSRRLGMPRTNTVKNDAPKPEPEAPLVAENTARPTPQASPSANDEILARAQAGDHHAFAQLYSLHKRRIYSL